LRLAQDPEPAAAAAALERLNAIDSNLVVPLAEQAMRNDDPHVRKQGVDAYVAHPSPQRAAIVARLLDDPHPAIRSNVREQLYHLAQSPECGASIREAVMAMLTNASWRGQEQAALLLGALDHKPAAPEMVSLLESQRAEVMVAAAWGLRKLAVADTLPSILDKAARQTDARTRGLVGMEVDLQVAHLFEAMGAQKYAPAESLWRKYVPKDLKMGEYSRGAAIWSLGRLYTGRQDEALARLLVQRLTDPAPPPMTELAELMRVRVMSAVALARLRAVSQVERMRLYLGAKAKPIPSSQAIRWAIHELTGENLPEPEPAIIAQPNWFLVPLDDGPLDDGKPEPR
jgi:HEAT repeat protein